jgi:hypothetical protein
MKIIFILIFGLTALLHESLSEEEIDFNPKLLHKELDKLSSSDFRLNEIQLQDSVGDNIKLNGKFFTIACKGDMKYITYIGRVQCCRAGGCSNIEENDTEFENEYFDYFILFDLQKRVITIRVFNYAATHGQEIMAKGWLNQFIGFDGTKTLRVGKEIDSISGATISVNGINDDVRRKTLLLKSFLNM